MTKVVLIHTVEGNVKVFGDLVQEIAVEAIDVDSRSHQNLRGRRVRGRPVL